MEQSFIGRFISSIDANRTLKDELAEAASRQRARRRISVTDLVNPRQAFFRWTHPEIQPTPERLRVMLSGTGFHDLFGRAFSTEEFTEQFVEFEGIVGKIDIYEDIPTELKTSGSIPADVLASRPGYIDQLGMYCTMVGKPNGRLVVYKRAEYGRQSLIKAFEAEYLSLDAIGAEMRSRRDSLHDALATGKPDGLPRCEWFDVGCDYRDICGCESARPLERIVHRAGVRIQENPDFSASLIRQLEESPEPPVSFRLNDLVFPRKAALERQPSRDEDEHADTALETVLAGMERQGFRGALYQALRFGIPGAFKLVPVAMRSLKGKVSTFRGVPTILRSTRKPEMVPRNQLVESFPYYFDRIAFECAMCGNQRGRVVIYYESFPDEKFMVYDVNFTKLENILAEGDRRLALLESGAPPHELPACRPPWMAKFCKWAPGCGCGSE